MQPQRAPSPKQDEEKNKLKSQINDVFAEIMVATDKVPKSIVDSKFERAKAWKEKAVTWRTIAKKGCGDFSHKKLEVLLFEAKQALAFIAAG
jgi:hypothetical protein